MTRFIRFAVAAGTLALLAPGCSRPVPPAAAVPDVVIAAASTIPADPNDAAWQAAPEHVAKLIPQDLVEPRQMQPTTGEVRVRAVSDGQRLAFRLQWSDGAQDDVVDPSLFSDACAVQLPQKLEATVPAPQMGEPNRPVEITFWKAAWQARVDGRGDKLQDLYPNATVDHYPFEAAPLKSGSPEQQEAALRYAPAKALGNLMAGTPGRAVQDLIATGPGTLAPATSANSDGRGVRGDDGWSVVIVRELPENMTTGAKSQVAFAVWQGEQQEVGSRKMRTGWIPLTWQSLP